ncbi:hypothetical protein CgunFtcFv8_005805 [Champsocephalus gunnari]|uniref:Uncharacterized protein n=1 Tax=Champsocephalus gunnari TaxID=52237 RepID=A0AAN8CZD6_CHAGU|nr:hypothetical protein CgunFtcFv8_005805 [Champsocephalus gunnari]
MQMQTPGRRPVSPRCSAPLPIVFGGHREKRSVSLSAVIQARAPAPPVLLPLGCRDTSLGRQGEMCVICQNCVRARYAPFTRLHWKRSIVHVSSESSWKHEDRRVE